MGKRTLTGIILVILLVPPFIIGGMYLNVTLMLLTLVASYELFKMFNTKSDLGNGILVTEMILAGITYFTIQSYYEGAIALEWAFLMTILLVTVGASMLVVSPKFSADNFGQLLVTVLYPALGFGAIFGLRSFSLYNIGFLFMVTIFTDVFAYFVGVRFGKHRLAVHISPKKSIEGSIGGTVVATILTVVYLLVFKIENIGDIQINIFTSIALIILISIIGQIGDLVASKLKRSFEIKDFSNIFPGHGGVMDRFDSAIFAAMVLMLISKFVGVL